MTRATWGATAILAAVVAAAMWAPAAVAETPGRIEAAVRAYLDRIGVTTGGAYTPPSPGGAGVSACVEATAAVAVGAGPTAVTYTTEVYDNDGMVDLGTNNDRITVQTTGKYEVRGSVEFDANTTGDRAIVLNHKNSGGSVVQAAVFAMKPTAYNNGIAGAWTFDAAAGDYFTIEVYQSRGANTDIGRRQLAATRVED